ncbi:4629_t:CDS:1 [Funneliformis mosseae]|uniref:4629_t:CDS:1 n=1 Tax=Funneliformis mosseae TaxID=27381 RepID=A0A9N8VEP4_FUNMO|nr:4629_t:CDS:1 [Funneliformis mosseae]
MSINDKHELHKNSTGLPIPTTSSFDPMNVDKCAKFGEITNCPQEEPYCFVDGNILECGLTSRMGWRISPLDGLILNNGQNPNPNCNLFNPPDQLGIKELIFKLLSESEFGLGFKDREPAAWYNSFDYLGNCPLRTQFCDEDLLICKNLFDPGNKCNSSNQCFTHLCGKRDVNVPEDITERICVDNTDLNDEGKEIMKRYKSLLIIVSLSIGFTMLIIVVTILFIGAYKKKIKIPVDNSEPINSPLSSDGPTNSQPGFVAKHLSVLNSRFSFYRSRPSSKLTVDGRRETFSSDNLSVLLPPPPTITNDVSLYNNPYTNNDHYSDRNVSQPPVRDSFDIYLSPNQTV